MENFTILVEQKPTVSGKFPMGFAALRQLQEETVLNFFAVRIHFFKPFLMDLSPLLVFLHSVFVLNFLFPKTLRSYH